MREILFRGKRKDNGEWVYGFLIICDERYFILSNNKFECFSFSWLKQNEYVFGRFVEVDPETVGQYTGLTDKNGTKIFEGDIVRIGFEDKFWETAREVVFEEGQWFFKCNSNSMKFYIGAWGNSVVEVIGNIHDNPELLKGEV